MSQSTKSNLHVAARRKGLQAAQLGGLPAVGVFEHLTRLACRLLSVPVALIALVDEDGQFFDSSQGLTEPQISQPTRPLLYALCQAVVTNQAPLVVTDIGTEPLASQNPVSTELMAYLGVPLTTAQGIIVGAFCAIDQQPRPWSTAELADLAELAELARDVLVMHQHWQEESSRERAWYLRVETYRTLFEQAGVGKMEFDLQTGEILRVNQKLRAITGYSAPELQALGAVGLLQPGITEGDTAGAAATDALAWQDLVTGMTDDYTSERRFLGKGGHTRWLQINVSRIRSENDEQRVLAIFQDITRSKETQIALQKSNALLQGVIDAISECIYLRDLSGRYLLVNRSGAALQGLTPQEMVGRLYTDLFPAATVAQIQAEDQLALSADQTYKFEFALVHQGVPRTFHSTRSAYHDVDGSLLGILTVEHEITDRVQAEAALRASEANFRTLFESMTQGVMYQDAEGKITAANPAAAEILGVTLEELQGRKSIDPRWRATRLDGSDFPGEEHPAMVALRTGELQLDILMNVFNPRKQEQRCLRIDAIPQFRQGETRPYQVYTLFQDITEQRRADAERAFHAQLLRQIHDAVIATDAQLNINAWNRGAEQMYGWLASEVMGLPARQVVRSEIDEDRRQMAFKELHQKGLCRIELITHHKDGTRIPTEGITAALYDSQGQITGYLTINRDITERRHSEAALKESTEQLQMITDSVPGLIAYIDRDEHYRFVNATYESWYGVPRDSILGQKIRDFVRPTTYAKAQPHIAKVLAGQSTTFEVETLRDDKPVTWLMKYTPRFGTDNQVLGFYTLTTDITERKQIEITLQEREQRFRATFEQTAVGIAHCDLAGTYIRVNHYLGELLGYQRAELLQKNFQAITHPEDQANSQAHFQQLLAGDCESYSIEQRYLRKDGTYLWGNVTMSLVRNLQTQAPDYCIGVIQDISDRKRYEQELEELNSSLERRVANRTHQLQTSNAKLLTSEAKLRQLSQQLMQLIEQERTRISREIHDQLGQGLTAIKMELKVGQRRLDPSQTAVRERLESAESLLDETVQTVRRIAADLRPGLLDDFGLGVAVEWQMQQFQTRSGLACQCQVQFDEAQLRPEMATAAFRILQEALTNIIRHAQASQVRVGLQIVDNEFRMSVQDNGRGMSEADQERASLGLLGMRERAQQVGGTLEITSALGEGTTVLLRLPCHK